MGSDTLRRKGVVTSSGRGTTKTKADRGSAALIYASVFLSIVTAYGFAYAGLGILAGWFFYLGIA